MEILSVNHDLITETEPLQRLIPKIAVGLAVMKKPTVTAQTTLIHRDTIIIIAAVMIDEARKSRGIGASNL